MGKQKRKSIQSTQNKFEINHLVWWVFKKITETITIPFHLYVYINKIHIVLYLGRKCDHFHTGRHEYVNILLIHTICPK